MSRLHISISTYLKITWACLASLYVIIVTGSLVRLTGSGLGCADWPRCSEREFVDVSSVHGAIEQINRLFTGFVAALVIVATMCSLMLRTRVKRLTQLSLGLVGGVVVQILLGAIVVLSGLHPLFNMAHYLVSIGLVTLAFLLVTKTRSMMNTKIRVDSLPFSVLTQSLAKIYMTLLGAVLVAGTVVTGSGPHAGDETAPRFSYLLTTVTRIHAVFVWSALVTLVALIFQVHRNKTEFAVLGKALEVSVALVVAQGALGYLQYFAGVPAGLVAIHVASSVAVWISGLIIITRISTELIAP